jgi:glycosyltransferase involved in cell wall biosynthesis
MDNAAFSSWICCQLGAREHYAVPRALQLRGLLSELYTDLWIRPGSLLHWWKKQLTGRFHPELKGANVVAPNMHALSFELATQRRRGWDLISMRNEWFQSQAAAHFSLSYPESGNGNHTVFAYSYAAGEIFKVARKRGWRTVLGQIDPGPVEEQIVAGLHKQSALKADRWEPAPKEYWDKWRLECELADQIVVNSSWSESALLKEGVSPNKIRVLPLAYEADGDSRSFQRQYPAAFTAERPLRVLFLGQINLRKGIEQLFEAIRLLSKENVEFWFVGPRQVCIPAELNQHPRVRWFGVVPRVDVASYFRDADVFILPTLSDGFGLTQLEAQSWRLPVIASRNCGEVVQDGVNGVILKEVSGPAIAEVLLNLLRSPETLRAMSTNSGVNDRFSLETLATSLIDL